MIPNYQATRQTTVVSFQLSAMGAETHSKVTFDYFHTARVAKTDPLFGVCVKSSNESILGNVLFFQDFQINQQTHILRDRHMGDVSKEIARLFRVSFNELNGTDYIEKKPRTSHTDVDIRLLDPGGNIREEVQHVRADTELLMHHSAIAFHEIGGTLQHAVDQSGVKKDFLLSVSISNNLPKKMSKRIKLVEELWKYLEDTLVKLRKEKIRVHDYEWDELADSCGEEIADAFTRVRVNFVDKEYKDNVIRPGMGLWVSNHWIFELISNAIKKKASMNYPNPNNLILLVELCHVPPSQDAIAGIVEALRSNPPKFKEVWLVSGFMMKGVRVWPD